MKTKELLSLKSQATLTNMARRRFRWLPKTRPIWLRMIPKIAPLLLRRELDIGTCGFSLKKEAVQWSISRFWVALLLYFDKPFQSQARASKTLCTERKPLPCLSKHSRHTLILTSAYRDVPLSLQHIPVVVPPLPNSIHRFDVINDSVENQFAVHGDLYDWQWEKDS